MYFLFCFKDVPPKNMFVINNEYDAENLLVFIERNNLMTSQGNFKANFRLKKTKQDFFNSNVYLHR